MPNHATMLLKPFFLVLLSAALAGQASGQPGIIIPGNINLPRDSATRIGLIRSLNGFLDQKEKLNKDNRFVAKDGLLATSALLDEMKGMEKNNKLKNDHFYKACLSNIVQLNPAEFLVQFAYLGVSDSIPELRANFELIARRGDGQFYFYSPLRRNTAFWKTTRIGDFQFHYKDVLNDRNARAYLRKIAEYDKKLSAASWPSEFYFCDDFEEVLRLTGIDYKSDYSGYSHNTLTAHENDSDLVIDGVLTSDFANFDPHDLWHSRLHKVLSIDTINRPVDEGCAYLYGGSWGLSWEEILRKFKVYAAAHPEADWLALYNNPINVDPLAKYPLETDYIINALLVQKIEKEKGFPAVMELLACGKKQKGNKNYFNSLERITGISTADFSSTLWTIIR